jgi:D-alanyl-D-alanine dipeptidase
MQSLYTEIRVELNHSPTANFLPADIYGDLGHCYLQKEVAEKLITAQKILRKSKVRWGV